MCEIVVSVVMIVKDEEDNIAAALRSVEGLAGELVVCDTGSTDRTVEIAESLGARVVHFPWNGSFADARNHAMSFARGKWIFILDADEAVRGTDFENTLANMKKFLREAGPVRVTSGPLTRAIPTSPGSSSGHGCSGMTSTWWR